MAAAAFPLYFEKSFLSTEHNNILSPKIHYEAIQKECIGKKIVSNKTMFIGLLNKKTLSMFEYVYKQIYIYKHMQIQIIHMCTHIYMHYIFICALKYVLQINNKDLLSRQELYSYLVATNMGKNLKNNMYVSMCICIIFVEVQLICSVELISGIQIYIYIYSDMYILKYVYIQICTYLNHSAVYTQHCKSTIFQL